MSHIEIIGIEKQFNEHRVLQGIHLTIEKGEFLTLLGPSGCGKSTLLRILAGFLECEKGMIRMENRDISQTPANRRDMGFVFQAYALFPNMDVFENIAFGLRMRKIPKKEIDRRVYEILDIVGLSERARYMPYNLSGGQQQRVALARALAPEPSVLLLDEPLSALDAKIRLSMRGFIKEIQKNLGITTIFVTHDQEEALSISDRIVIMQEGRILQIGTPNDLYHHPCNSFVAQFIGTTNLLTIHKVKEEQVYLPFVIPLQQPVGSEFRYVSIRPEMIEIKKLQEDSLLQGRVVNKSLLGSVVRYNVKVGDLYLLVDVLHKPEQTDLFLEDSLVGIDIPPSACMLLK